MDCYKEAYLRMFNRVADLMDELLHLSLECEAMITATPSAEDKVKEEQA